MRKRVLLLGLCLLLALPGCVNEATEPSPTAAYEPSPVAAATPTPTDPATATPSPAETPAPTDPAETTATAEPSPLETPAPTDTAKPTTTATPSPSETPAQTAAAAATATASPSPVETTPAPSEPAETTPPPAPAQSSAGAGMVAGAGYNFAAAVPETAAVDESYFDDAVFIGDSRTDGFRLYSGIKNAEFIVQTGLSVFQVETRNITYKGQKMKVLDALGKGTYGKVYVSMGINELGMRNDKGYHNHFADLIDGIRAKQPNATIYIQLLIPVNEQKSREKGFSEYIENGQVRVYNDILRQVAQEKHVFLVDPAEDLVDETGEPPYDSVADGVHFQRAPYKVWFEYLKRHTIDKGDWNG